MAVLNVLMYYGRKNYQHVEHDHTKRTNVVNMATLTIHAHCTCGQEFLNPLFKVF